MPQRFSYYILYRRDHRTDPPVGLLAEGRVDPNCPLRVIGWSHRSRTWTEAADSLAEVTSNPEYEDRFRMVDRATAEATAREHLGATLPTEEEMQRIGDQAATGRRETRP